MGNGSSKNTQQPHRVRGEVSQRTGFDAEVSRLVNGLINLSSQFNNRSEVRRPISNVSNHGELSQWIRKVVAYSSQYDDKNWSATCVIGSPKVYPKYGDKPGVWAPAVKDNKQFLELEVKESVYITGIDIYETYHCGGVTAVKALRSPNTWQTLWRSAQPFDSNTSRIFSPPLMTTDFKTKIIRIEIDCTACRSWVEIDAVKIHGTRDLSTCKSTGQLVSPGAASQTGVTSQWIDKVISFSSQYDDRNWPATCVIGSPKVYPKYGDIPGAWAPGVKDQKQFLELEVADSVYITGIDIYETYHCGGVTAVKALRSPNTWQTLWRSAQPFDSNTSRIFSPPLMTTDFKTKIIRIEIDCTACRSWVEIDAVKIHGTRDLSTSTSTGQLVSPGAALQNDTASQTGVTSQWIDKVVSFSSQYDGMDWPATCVIGSPKVYPNYGDIPGAWAPGVINHEQFLELEVAESVYLTGIDIYETYHCGGVTAVKALRSPNNWHTLWESSQPFDSNKSRIFSPPIMATDFKTKIIRIEIDCTACKTWVEIDAVKIHGTRNLSSTKNGQLVTQGDVLPKRQAPCDSSDCATSQWVNKVISFSSQYDNKKWPATCVIGIPKVYPMYGDIPGAWAPGVIDNKQFLELEVAESVYITGIDIYETYHCGGVTAVKALRSPNNWQTLWQTAQPIDSRISRVFTPPLIRTDFKTKTIRIEVNCSACRSWVEIDAIMLHGERKLSTSQSTGQGAVLRDGGASRAGVTSQWVDKIVSFSSQYGNDWSATCVIGSPKVYPNYGDIRGAWAPGVTDDNQYLELEVKESVYITGVDIYETYHCGGVTAVKALRSPNNWHTLWESVQPFDITVPRIFSPPIKQVDWKTNRIRIDVNCSACRTWVEIDAVQIHGYRDSNSGTPAVDTSTAMSSGAIGGTTETVDLSQWVKHVTNFSSQYDQQGWHAINVIGVPNVYPEYGDKPGTWAQHDSCLDGLQFLEVEFHEPVYVSGIEIYEIFHAGGVVAIQGLNDDRTWQTLWKTDTPTNIESSRVFSPPLNTQAFSCATKNIRIEVNCTAARYYVEIDAIRLHGCRYPTDAPPSYDSLNHDIAYPPVYSSMEPALMPSAPIVPVSHAFIEPVINDKASSDCQFLLEGKHTVYAHKAVICEGNGNIKQLFNEEAKEPMSSDGKIMKEISGISHVGFLGLLQHIYHSRLPEGYKSVMDTGDWNGTSLNDYTCLMLIDVWRAGDKFKMEDMKSTIEVGIISKVDEHNVIEIYKAVSETSPVIETIKDYCKQYMTQNMEKIVNSPNFTSLPHDIMAYPY